MEQKKVICDSDIIIDYWDNSQKRYLQTKDILEKNIGLDNVILSAVTKMELISGAKNKTDLGKINKDLNAYHIALINNDITIGAFNLLQKYRLSHGLSLPDCLIASTAIVSDLELFTYNIKDYKFIPNLKLYKF